MIKLLLFVHLAATSCLWQNKNLKWSASEGEEQDDKKNITNVFNFWQAGTDFHFVRVSRAQDADIVVNLSSNVTSQSTHYLEFDRNLSSSAFWNLAVHNLGHSLGLEDVSNNNATADSVMNPANVRHYYARVPYVDAQRLDEIYKCTGLKFLGQLNDCVLRAYYETRVITLDRCRRRNDDKPSAVVEIVPRNRSDGTVAFFGGISVDENNRLYSAGKFETDLTDLNIYRPVRAVALFESGVLTVIYENSQFIDFRRDDFFPEMGILEYKFDVVPTGSIAGAGRTGNSALLFDDMGHYHRYNKKRDGIWKLDRIDSIDRRLLCEKGLCLQKRLSFDNNDDEDDDDSSSGIGNRMTPLLVLIINMLFIAMVKETDIK